jgi:hypothetical protein
VNQGEHYQADQLREPFTLVRITQVSDSQGGYTDSEATTGPHFAYVRPLRGAERQVNDQLSGIVEALFVVYAGVGVKFRDVLVYNGVRYNVRSVKPAGMSNFQEVEAESGVID